MGSLLFRNIAGRCGRAGSFTEGDTVIFDNVLGNTRFTHPRIRREHQNELFSDPPELDTAIANDNIVPEEIEGVNAVVTSQLMAAIPENPHDGSLEDTLAQNLYAHFRGRDARGLLKQARFDLLSTAQGEPFAVAASPMRLTALGEAANRTGFSPPTCRALIAFLRELKPSDDVPELLTHLLLVIGTCPEQGNRYLRDVVVGKTARVFVKQADLNLLVKGWLDGRALPELFSALTGAKRSKATVSPSVWLSGEGESDFVAGQYDNFVQLAEHTFANFLPWVLRACEALSKIVGGWGEQYEWRTVAEMLENAAAVDLVAMESQERSE